MIRPFLIALQFLTRLPVRLSGNLEQRDLSRSLLYYPLVGLILGAILAAAGWLLDPVSPLLGGALILALWVMLTGALHLDGLADSIDAWAGGRGEAARTLAIMKDPHSGPQGVTGLVVVLLTKFATLVTLLAAGAWPLLVLPPLLGRTALPLLFVTTPYVRPGGLGSPLAQGLPRGAAAWVIVGGYVLPPLLAGLSGLLALIGSWAAFVYLRDRMKRRIGGTTGDTAGALVEITETLALIALGLSVKVTANSFIF